MGALTNNRKRGDDYYKSLVSPSSPISKRPKLSLSPAHRTPENSLPQPMNSIASKIAKYPDRKPGVSREVHAPVRNSRFGSFSSGKSCETAGWSRQSPERGSSFSQLRNSYKEARSVANRSLRYLTVRNEKGKEVIELDSEDEGRDDVIDDGSIEELKIVDSVDSKWKSRQKDVDEPKLRTFEKEVRSIDSSVITDAGNAVVKVDDGDKDDFMQLDQGLDDSQLPWYKRLHDRIRKKYDGKLESLNNQIEVREQRMRFLHLLWPQKKEEKIKKDAAKECFTPLTEEEKKEVSFALSNSNRRKILVTHENSNIDITGEKLQCLRPGAWLNDEVINLYLELLKEREGRDPEKFLKCHFFNTFFYKKLISGRGGYNFQSVKRWTTQRKLGYSLSKCDKIFVPIHKEVHWCLAIINRKDKKFQYLDSLRGVDSQVLDVLARYYVDEVKDKCGEDINVSSWESEFVTDLPEQANGFDCGVFMIKYADFYSRGLGLCFSQENMPYFRLRTAKEILKLRAE